MSARFDFFSIDTYNRLPSLGEAHAVFIDNDGEQFLREVVQPMMRRHAVQNVFAVNLAYTHTTLQHGQRVVGMAASSRAMMCDSDHDGTLRSLFPASWTITSDGRMMECEYGFLPRGHAPPPVLDDEAYNNFLAEFIESARNANLDRVLGLVLRSPGPLVLLLEVSEGEERHVFWPQDVSQPPSIPGDEVY